MTYTARNLTDFLSLSVISVTFVLMFQFRGQLLRFADQDNFLCNELSKESADQAEASCELTVPADKRMLLAVFDGMGGLSAGEIASDIAASTLREECWW